MSIVQELCSLVAKGRVFDLGMTLSVETPHHPNHTPYSYRLTKKHGDVVHESGASASNDMFTMGTHVGTHIDALGHIAEHGCMFGGHMANVDADVRDGIPDLGIDKGLPIVGRGILLDVAGLLGVECLETRYEVSADDIEGCLARQGTTVREGDCVLIRTGWERHFGDARTYVGLSGAPGPGVEAACKLAELGMTLTGSDTLAYERQPAPGFPVHVELMVKRGIQIMECMALEALAAAKAYEFLFVALPIKIAGGTGAPIRPIAIA